MEKLSREKSERKLPLPVGKSNWEYIAAHNYCVDKTLLIRDLIAADEWMARQGKYPVIYLIFKDHKARTWESAVKRLKIDMPIIEPAVGGRCHESAA